MSNQATPVIGHGTNNLDSGIDLGEAASGGAFLDMANDMLGIEPEDEPTEEPADEAEDAEEQDLDETDEDLESEEEDEDDESDEEDSEEESDEEEDEDSEESTTYIVKIDGEELEVDEDELLGGYQRQRDYTKKTQEIAEQRKELESLSSELQSERDKYVKALESVLEEETAQLEKYNNVDWNKLKEEDPNQFLLLQHEMNDVRQKLESKRKAREEALSATDKVSQELEAKRLEKEQERVATLIEGWGGENHQEIVSTLQEQASKEGFTDEDGELFKNAMVVKLLHKASQFDALKAKKESVVEKKVKKKVPKVVKSGVKQGQTDSKQLKARKQAVERVKQTGNINDAAQAMASFL